MRDYVRIAYLDCSNGISGDMFLAALLDAGLEIVDLRKELAKLSISGYGIAVKKVKQGNTSASQLIVNVRRTQRFRHLPDIRKIITLSKMTPAVKKKAVSIFERLGRAEAQVHGCSINDVHFHEIGAIDTIVDIVGVVWGLHKLGIKKLFCSPINVGSGKIKIAHGVFPVPAPATAELLRNVPYYQSIVKDELTTPTGAVLVAGLSAGFGPKPELNIEFIGQSSGSRKVPGHTNLCCLLIGKANTNGSKYEKQ